MSLSESLNGCTFTSPGSIITSPGDTINISWSVSSFSTNVSIYLEEVQCHCSVGRVAINIRNTGTYLWRVPTNFASLCSYGFYIENMIKTNWCYDPSKFCISSTPALIPSLKPSILPTPLPTLSPSCTPSPKPSPVPSNFISLTPRGLIEFKKISCILFQNKL